MKKRQHKYFRNQRYKQRLEHEVDNHRTYYSNVYFVTKEPDPRHLREDIHMYRCRGKWKITDEEWIARESKPDDGRDTFTYYKRPEVPYSIQYYHKSPRRSACCVYLKKKTSRRLRQRWKQYGETYQHNDYRRTTEFWWELD